MSSKIKEFIIEQGYTKYIYLGKWLDYSVYQPRYDEEFLNEFYNDEFVIVDYDGEIRMASSIEAYLIKDTFFKEEKNIQTENIDEIDSNIKEYRSEYLEIYEALKDKKEKMKNSIIRTGILSVLGVPSFLQNLSAFDAGCNYSKYKEFSENELKSELKTIFYKIAYPEYCKKDGNMEFWDIYFYIAEKLEVDLTELDKNIISDLTTKIYLEYNS